MAYMTTAALFQFLGILCGLISILLESYAFQSDGKWNRLVDEYERNLTKKHIVQNVHEKVAGICVFMRLRFDGKTKTSQRRKEIEPFFPSSILNRLQETDLKHDQKAEQFYLAINVLITFMSSFHLAVCCVTKKIIYRTKYNAIIHGGALFLLILGSVLLMTSKYTIEYSFVKIAKATLECDQFMACIQTPETEAHEYYYLLKSQKNYVIEPPGKLFRRDACQQHSLKIAAAIVSIIYTFLCGCVLCSAMNVVIQYGDEEFVSEQQEETDFATNQRLSFSYDITSNNIQRNASVITASSDGPVPTKSAMAMNKHLVMPRNNPSVLAMKKYLVMPGNNPSLMVIMPAEKKVKGKDIH